MTDSSFDNMIELAEIISDRSVVSDATIREIDNKVKRKKISKTSMLIAILGSLTLMILCEIVTAIYKNISEGGFICNTSL